MIMGMEKDIRTFFFDKHCSVKWPNIMTDIESRAALGKTGIIDHMVRERIPRQTEKRLSQLVVSADEHGPQVPNPRRGGNLPSILPGRRRSTGEAQEVSFFTSKARTLRNAPTFTRGTFARYY